jgi:hypothetical protein
MDRPLIKKQDEVDSEAVRFDRTRIPLRSGVLSTIELDSGKNHLSAPADAGDGPRFSPSTGQRFVHVLFTPFQNCSRSSNSLPKLITLPCPLLKFHTRCDSLSFIPISKHPRHRRPRPRRTKASPSLFVRSRLCRRPAVTGN